jgi:2-aminoethylphosphonate-pyruvate transaminase
MIRQALILAAGRGRPVGDPSVPNSLSPVGGRPLLLRTLRVLRRAGVRRVGITVGYEGAALRRAVEAWSAAEPGLPEEIAFFENAAFDRPNGLSVLAARRFVEAPTLLLMADQIQAPRLVEQFVRLPGSATNTVLGVDRALSRVFDIDDATKVKLSADGRRVVDMGKGLAQYEAISTSLFVMAPSLIDCLDALAEPSLTEGVAEAARRGLVEALDVEGTLWQDVDSAEMRLHADWLLRAYGDELERPAVPGVPPSAATDTLALIERLLAEKDAPHYVLLNPGPVITSARVKAALVHYDVCHRDEDYEGVVQRLQTKLRPIFGASPSHDLLLLTGSGTAAMEMSISAVVPPGKKILTIENGAFGERLGEIAALHGLPRQVLRYPWGTPIDPADVARALDADPEIAAVAVIHHETSVGLLNPVGAIGRACHERGALLVVDAVSALGAEDVDVVRDQVDICYSSANKCLHSVSGVSFLCVAPRVWARLEATPPRVYYLDLRRYRRYLTELHQTPFTPAVSAFFALETALDELEEQGGVAGRREIYRRRNLRIRRVFGDLGFVSYTNTGRESCTISTLRVPPFVAVDDLYDRLKARGYVIYKCKGALAADHVQIANMGELPDATIDAFLAAVTDIVETARRDVDARPEIQRLRSV